MNSKQYSWETIEEIQNSSADAIIQWADDNDISEYGLLNATEFAQERYAGIPRDKKSLLSMTHLQLDNYPDTCVDFPEEFKYLRNITHLTLMFSEGMRTDLQKGFCHFPNLTHLTFDFIYFQELTQEIYELKKLTHIEIKNGVLEKLSPDIVKLENLTHLNLQNNYGVSVPKEIMKLKKLDTLMLKGTKYKIFGSIESNQT
ncbi:MAG: hypothetical protein U9O56_03460 [Campylobacterota bacterium]|nr:hypothetical protein [Campylobacterota bacterium]